MTLFAFFGAPWEMIIVGLVALLLFGNRLPNMMRGLGEGITEFKKGINGISEPLQDAANSVKHPLEKVTCEIKQAVANKSMEI